MDRPSPPVIPYGRQWITEEEISRVGDVLRSDVITQGPEVARFEEEVAGYVGARFAVAVANGTAALHAASLAAGFAAGDEVITSPITFVASANCILYAGARPVFADVSDDTICLDPAKVRAALSPATRGIVAVHFAGHPCDMPALRELAGENGLTVIEDAAHALGATYRHGGKEHRVGSCAHSHMTTFSFHPVKHVTTGEGGMVTTNDPDLHRRLVLMRNHGITRDPALLERQEGPWWYEMQELGLNYRITDFQCALGRGQLARLPEFVRRRRDVVRRYREALGGEPALSLPPEREGCLSSWHIFPVRLKGPDRARVFRFLREEGLGVNVHYIPVYLQPYYRRLGYREGTCPGAERYYREAITLPVYPRMTDDDVERVIGSVRRALEECR